MIIPVVDIDGHIVESIPRFAARDSESLAKVADVPDRAPGADPATASGAVTATPVGTPVGAC